MDYGHCHNPSRDGPVYIAAARLADECNRVLGGGVGVIFRGVHFAGPYRDIPSAVEFCFHRNCDLADDILKRLQTFFRTYSGHLDSIRAVAVTSTIHKSTYDSARVKLSTICKLVYCLGFSGFRFNMLELFLNNSCREVLEANDVDCAFFGTLIRAFALNLHTFRFWASFAPGLLEKNDSFDAIIDSVRYAWVRAPVSRNQKFILSSNNVLDHASVSSIRELCRMEFCPGMGSLDLRYFGARGMELLSLAVGSSLCICNGRRLNLTFEKPCMQVRALVRSNRIFSSLRLRTPDYQSEIPVGSLLALWGDIFASTTEEVICRIPAGVFSAGEMERANGIIDSGLNNNVTLVRFQGLLGLYPGNIESRVQMYTSLNRAQRSRITPQHSGDSHVLMEDVVGVLSRLMDLQGENDGRYFVLRRYPEIVSVPSTAGELG